MVLRAGRNLFTELSTEGGECPFPCQGDVRQRIFLLGGQKQFQCDTEAWREMFRGPVKMTPACFVKTRVQPGEGAGGSADAVREMWTVNHVNHDDTMKGIKLELILRASLDCLQAQA